MHSVATIENSLITYQRNPPKLKYFCNSKFEITRRSVYAYS